MKNRKTILGLVLSLTMIFTNISPALAASQTSKEEVIYVNSKANGDVKNIEAVNIFKKGEVIDYGNYSNAKLLNSNQDIKKDGDKISFTSDKDRTYLQANMDSKNMPWDINIKYFLNGKEIDEKDISGKNGNIKIKIKIKENKNMNEEYFENYALQINTKLDTNKFENIKSPGATLANEGEDKLITYTALPGKGLDSEISAKAQDFTFPGFSINAVKLNLNVDIDQENLDGKINELIDASKKLNEGSNEINLKSNDLKSASSALNSGINELANGNIKLTNGVDSLHSGILTVQNGLDTLNGKSPALVDGSNKVQNALDEIDKSLGQISINSEDIDKLSQSSNKINKSVKEFDHYLNMAVSATNPRTYKESLKKSGLDQDYLRSSNQEAIGKIDSQIALLNKSLELSINQDNLDNENPPVENNEENLKNNTENDSKEDIKENEDPYPEEENLENNEQGQENLENPEKEQENYEKNIKTDTRVFKTSNAKADMIREQIAMLEETKRLLMANNANIDGTNKYLKSVNDSFTEISEKMSYLNENYQSFDGKIQELSTNLKNLSESSIKLERAITDLNNNYKVLNQSTKAYTEAVNKLSQGNRQILLGVESLSSANSKLVKGSNDLKSGSSKLDQGIQNYTDGVDRLDDGLNEFYNETNNMDEKLNEKIDQIRKSLGDENTKTNSFTSNKNGEIKSLQFVIKTDEIKKEKKENRKTEKKKEEKSIIDKFLDLFK